MLHYRLRHIVSVLFALLPIPSFAQGPWVMTDIGAALSGSSHVVDVNNVDQALINEGAPAFQTYVWKRGKPMIPIPADAGYVAYVGEHLSNTGQVVGYHYTSPPPDCPSCCQTCVVKVFSWTAAGGTTDIGSLGGNRTFVYGVNDAGQVVGSSEITQIDPVTGIRPHHAFVWSEEDGMIDLGTLPGHLRSAATAINNGGHIVGWSESPESARRAFVWTAATGMVEIPDPDGSVTPLLVNNAGQVAGTRYTQAVPFARAFSWTATGGMIDLDVLPGDLYSYPVALNDLGQIVGSSRFVGSCCGMLDRDHAFSWTVSGGMVALSADFSSDASDVNNSGQVVGSRYESETGFPGVRYAFFWTATGGLTDLGQDRDAYAINEAGAIGGSLSTGSATHAVVWTRTSGPSSRTHGDFDGDGKSDAAIIRPSTGYWYVLNSSGTPWTNRLWGVSGDVPVPGDYDGDDKTDIGMYRPALGAWYLLQSTTNDTSALIIGWGVKGDAPVPGDYDGDGKTDVAIYRPSLGEWFVLKSSTDFTTWTVYHWGLGFMGDLPIPGDFDADGRTDIAVYRPPTGEWFILKSSSNFSRWDVHQWGTVTDTPLAGDFDGDGKTDCAVYRPSDTRWYILQSSANFTKWTSYGWGVEGDIPISGDYDGDGKTDVTMYRPSAGYWFVLLSSTNFTSSAVYQWGITGDRPVFEGS